MARLTDLVVDCAHPASLARFWAAALDGYRVAAYDDAERQRLRELGVTDVEDDPTVLLERVDGGRPRIWFQRVPEPKVAKNRLHVDLCADDVDAEVFRLVAHGAVVLDDQPDPSLIVMHDPEGNEFCLLRPE